MTTMMHEGDGTATKGTSIDQMIDEFIQLAVTKRVLELQIEELTRYLREEVGIELGVTSEKPDACGEIIVLREDKEEEPHV